MLWVLTYYVISSAFVFLIEQGKRFSLARLKDAILFLFFDDIDID